MRYGTIIQPAEAAPWLGNPDWLFVDCRYTLGQSGSGRNSYLQEHIPGAVYADLEEDLSGPVEPGRTGRHPLPRKAKSAWKKAGLPTDDRPSRPPHETQFEATFRDDLVTDSAEVLRNSDKRVLVDSRATDRYRGESEKIDPIGGHIPGAYSLPFSGNLTDDGAFRSPGELRDRFERLKRNSDTDVIIYCGSGVTAAHNVLAFAIAYSEMPKLYAGSWSEWITDSKRGIARGDNRAGTAEDSVL